MTNERSQALFSEAQRFIPGGVNSPARAFKSVGLTPPFIRRGSGARLWDEDDNEYVDYVCSWGPLILGHAHEAVVSEVCDSAGRGTSYGAATGIEVEFARLIAETYPSIDMIRMVNSGTEATMSAVRLARGFTRRDKIIKFEGSYHGHADSFLIKAGSGALTLGIPGSPGVTQAAARDTLVATFNNSDSVASLLRENKGQVAAVIIEPVMGNAGVIPPRDGFLGELRELTAQDGCLLIFDEVMTGFRVALGGAQSLYGVRPDLTCLGKIIGGGLPVGAFGGRRDVMEMLAPVGPVYQAGTLSGNPLAMAAGYSTVRILRDSDAYDRLETAGATLEAGMKDNLKRLGLRYTVNRVGSMLTLFFTSRPVTDFESAVSSDTRLFAAYYAQMLHRGVYLPPSQFEALFVSTAHTAADLELTIKANYDSLKALARS